MEENTNELIKYLMHLGATNQEAKETITSIRNEMDQKPLSQILQEYGLDYDLIDLF